MRTGGRRGKSCGLTDAQIAALGRMRYSAAKKKNTSNTFLMSDGLYTNTNPVLVVRDAKVISVSASSEGIETWDAQIFKNGVLFYSMSVTAVSNKSVDELSLDILKDDKLSFYCDGFKINEPRISINTQ